MERYPGIYGVEGEANTRTGLDTVRKRHLLSWEELDLDSSVV
jgi:hypothetical protein